MVIAAKRENFELLSERPSCLEHWQRFGANTTLLIKFIHGAQQHLLFGRPALCIRCAAPCRGDLNLTKARSTPECRDVYAPLILAVEIGGDAQNDDLALAQGQRALKSIADHSLRLGSERALT